MQNKKNLLKLIYTPVMFGIIVGALAVLAQPLFGIQPPQAYGICTICHARDFVNWISISLFSYELETVAAMVSLPLITTVGIYAGALISSKFNKEYRRIKVENLTKMFFLGLLVSNFGLLIISCPTRLFLRFSFGDPFALLSLAGLFAGIALAVLILKRRF